MKLEEIRAIPVVQLADEDCRLFLWATSRYVPEAFNLLALWGFEYRQLLVWDKTPNFNPMTGSVAPIAGEFLFVAVRGRPKRVDRWTTSIVRARKARTEHSRKPEVFLDLVETVSPPPYLELFARRNRLGWDTWGNESLEMVSGL
jgi:N6-adenosine-specific RNA methylase IME4